MAIWTVGQMKNNINNSPMDYDLTFNKEDIPSNIKFNSSFDLNNDLKKYIPVNTTIHINLDDNNEDTSNIINIISKLETVYNGIKTKRRIL